MLGTKTKRAFRIGDKVIHKQSEIDLVGTVVGILENEKCIVEFMIPGRKRGGYVIELEFDPVELEPSFVDIGSTKRRPA